MRINGSQLHAVAFHSLSERYERTETLRAWQGNQRPDLEGRLRQGQRSADSSAISSGARGAHEASQASGPPNPGDEAEGPADPRARLLVAIIERMTGKKLHLVDSTQTESAAVEAPANRAAPQNEATSAQRPGRSVEYSPHEVATQGETTAFAAEGVLTTADAREIRFKAELRMDQDFIAENQLVLRPGGARLKDPLLLNFEGTAAELGDTTVLFDLDADGQHEAMRFLKPGSALLFLNVGGNERATHGVELFAAKTGKAFEELRRHDTDAEGGIAEEDPAFSFLRLLSQDGDGSGEVGDPGEADVRGTATPFALKDAANRLQGQIQATGVYLVENGGAATVQQLDLAV